MTPPLKADAGLVDSEFAEMLTDLADLNADEASESALREAAARIEALSAEVERLKQAWADERDDSARLHREKMDALDRALTAEAKLATIEAEVRADQRERDAKLADISATECDEDTPGGFCAANQARHIAAAIRKGDA